MISVDNPSITSPTEEPDLTPVNVPASLGSLGYAAFALVQPIPLNEMVPFPIVVAAFEAEAARLAEPEPEPEPEPVPAVVEQPAAPVAVHVAEPDTSFVEGGYRPSSPVMGSWSEGHGASSEEQGHPFAVTGTADGTGRGEAAALAEHTAGSEAEPDPAKVVPIPVDQVFSLGGYARDEDSGESRARQVLNELSFLFDDA